METSAPEVRERTAEAPVLEVFASIQGEGLYAGQPQTFLRLRGCPLRCTWCDTPGSWSVPAPLAAGRQPDHLPRARIATLAGARRDVTWATPFKAATWIAEVEDGQPRPVSVTGGEPLLWPAFIEELETFLGTRPIHLETAGAHPVTLERVLPAVDHVSLDLKLPDDLDPPVALNEAGAESVPASAADWARARRRCLTLVRDLDAALKLVVAGTRAARAFAPLLDDAVELAPDLPVFLQPVTPMAGVPAPAPELLRELVELALERSLAVRVVPQLHRAMGMP